MQKYFEAILKIFIKHISFFVMGVGALGIFFANISLKIYLSPESYYNYSILITVLTLLTSFGALGADQVLLRLSEVKKNELIVDRKIFILAAVNTIIMSIIAYLYLINAVTLDVSKIIIYFLCLSAILIMLLYNIFRLVSYFLVSQLIQNSWKILFGAISICIYFNNKIYNFTYELISVLIFVLLMIACIYFMRYIKISLTSKNSRKEIYAYAFHFFLALLTLSFLSQGDRFIIDSTFSKTDFGDYFYLATLFLFPFSLLQSYIGFKELIYFKTKYLNLEKKIKILLKRSAVFSFFLIVIMYGLSKSNVINLNFSEDLVLIIILVVIGNIKMIYALYSALIGARASLLVIKKMNIIFITSSVVLVLIGLNFINSIDQLLLLFFLLWLLRLSIWMFYSKSLFINEN